MTDSALIGVWRQHLAAVTAGLHLASAGHPLRIFIGKTDQGAPRMAIRADSKPTKPAISDVVLVERYQDQSDKWNLSFTLQDLKFTEVFLRLVDDLHARSTTALNEEMALDRVNVVFNEWRRLLKPRSNVVLTMEELRGLIGELWLLLTEFTKQRSMEAAVEGWLGPLGLPQDFWYPDDGYHEVKSIGPGTARIKISSENQLDADELELLVVQVGNVAEETLGAVNLPTLVDRVLAALSDVAATHESFSSRLQRLGVDLSESFYRETWFAVTELSSYDAGVDFPAIRARNLPQSISRVTYEVDLASLEEFRLRFAGIG